MGSAWPVLPPAAEAAPQIQPWSLHILACNNTYDNQQDQIDGAFITLHFDCRNCFWQCITSRRARKACYAAPATKTPLLLT
jgi:hypothetical protein